MRNVIGVTSSIFSQGIFVKKNHKQYTDLFAICHSSVNLVLSCLLPPKFFFLRRGESEIWQNSEQDCNFETLQDARDALAYLAVSRLG